MPQTNVEKGQAERGVAKLLKWLDSEETVMWDDDDVHIWRYREYSILRTGFLLVRGTVFDLTKGQRGVWHKFLLLLGVAAVVTLLSLANSIDQTQADLTSSLSSLLSGLFVFLLGWQVSDVKARFMSLKSAVSHLSDQIELLMLFIIKHEDDPSIVEKVHRHAFALFQLLWIAASHHENAAAHVEDLKLPVMEVDVLRGSSNPALMLVHWLHTSASGLPNVNIIIPNIKNSFDEALRLGSQQLPLPYVHLVSVLANLSLLALAMDCGQDVAFNLVTGVYSRVLFDLFKVFVLTFVYQGLLELQVILGRGLALTHQHAAHLPRVGLQKRLERNLNQIRTMQAQARPAGSPTRRKDVI